MTSTSFRPDGQARPVRVGLAGFGYWGRNLARNIRASSSLELVAVAEPDDNARANAAAQLPGVRCVTDLDALLRIPDLEGVLLATTASQHAVMARAVIDAGCHVFVEKPLALTVEDAEDVVQRADAAGVMLMVGHTFLYAAPLQRLRSYILAGELGDLEYLYTQRLSLGRIRRDCNAMWNFAPHDVAIMMALTGDRPVEVSARGFSFIGKGVDDVCFASLMFESGVGGNFHVSWIDPRKARLVTVVGSQKMAIYDDVSVDQKVQLVDAGLAPKAGSSFGEWDTLGDFQWRTRVGDILIPNIQMQEPLLVEMEAFGESCRTLTPSATDGRHGADVVRVLCALDESAAKRGRPVVIEWEPQALVATGTGQPAKR